MNRLFAGALLVLGSVCAAQAQDPAPAGIEVKTSAAPDFLTTSAARVNLITPVGNAGALFVPDGLAEPPANLGGVPPLSTALAVPLTDADPATPEPRPKFLFGGRDDYRWQLGLGIAWERFRSSVFNASAVGVNTSLGYFLNDWFGVEGDVSALFAPEILEHEHVKLLNYVVGPKIAWRQRRWEPWAHILVGGSHEQPQTAVSGKSAFALQAGGGADFRFNPRLSFRLNADYLHNTFFNQTQNNFLLGGGVVFHF
jgi:opacity protein-like surface antigen